MKGQEIDEKKDTEYVEELVNAVLNIYPLFMKFIQIYAPDEERRWELYRRLLEDEKVPSITKASIVEMVTARFESLLKINDGNNFRN